MACAKAKVQGHGGWALPVHPQENKAEGERPPKKQGGQEKFLLCEQFAAVLNWMTDETGRARLSMKENCLSPSHRREGEEKCQVTERHMDRCTNVTTHGDGIVCADME